MRTEGSDLSANRWLIRPRTDAQKVGGLHPHYVRRVLTGDADPGGADSMIVILLRRNHPKSRMHEPVCRGYTAAVTTADTSPDGDYTEAEASALSLAGELRDRVGRERAAVRRLQAYLSMQAHDTTPEVSD
jgi:hypothetical protein